MDQQSDLLEAVVQELTKRHGDLPKVARDTGIPVDTVRRIKNRENDPGYSKVQALHRYLFPPAAPSDAAAAPSDERRAA